MQKRNANSVIFNTGQIFVWSRDATAVTVSVTVWYQKNLTRVLLTMSRIAKVMSNN